MANRVEPQVEGVILPKIVMVANEPNTTVSREEFEELRNAYNALSGSVFAQTAMISLLAEAAVRRKATAWKITEKYFLEYLSRQDQLTAPLARKTAVATFRAFVEDAQSARRALEQEPKPRPRSLLKRLVG